MPSYRLAQTRDRIRAPRPTSHVGVCSGRARSAARASGSAPRRGSVTRRPAREPQHPPPVDERLPCRERFSRVAPTYSAGWRDCNAPPVRYSLGPGKLDAMASSLDAMFNIRPVCPEDLARVCELNVQLGYSGSLAEMRARFDAIAARPDQVTLVSEVARRVAGWLHAQAQHTLESGSYVEIVGLVVSTEARRQDRARPGCSRPALGPRARIPTPAGANERATRRGPRLLRRPRLSSDQDPARSGAPVLIRRECRRHGRPRKQGWESSTLTMGRAWPRCGAGRRATMQLASATSGDLSPLRR
jgi:hypothetical protein